MKTHWEFCANSEMQKVDKYKVPSSWEARELLRERGQFWTPSWIAEPMVEYALADKDGVLFDPAVGTGAFFRAARAVAREKRLAVNLTGMEIDPATLDGALESGLSEEDAASVTIADFLLQPPQAKFSAIVANPPYIRHHRISPDRKAQLRRLGTQTIGKPLDGRAGLHVYFLIQALLLLKANGRLAFIMPADTCEGKFSHDLWSWILANFALDAVVTFSPEASPFPDVDTNPLILLLRKAPPKDKFLWAVCCRAGTGSLKEWISQGLPEFSMKDVIVMERELKEGLTTGLSRRPTNDCRGGHVLGDFACVMRGVATGANDFFFMTAQRAEQLKIPRQYFVRAIGRTRDVSGEAVTSETIEWLESKGRPTLLLSLNGDDAATFPEPLRQYLQKGERLRLPERPLISQRKPWYRMEARIPPPFLFAYLGRRCLRFIRNTAGVIPLTGFLCVYPKVSDEAYLEEVWRMLNHPDTIANLSLVGKSYGNGAIKVEPRSLEHLPIPDHVIEQSNLPLQGRLLEPGVGFQSVHHLADSLCQPRGRSVQSDKQGAARFAAQLACAVSSTGRVLDQ